MKEGSRGAEGRREERLLFQSIDDAMDSVDEFRDVEVDQEPKMYVPQSKIGQQLLPIDERYIGRRFDFDNDFLLNDQI